jgi:hypothetical protein
LFHLYCFIYRDCFALFHLYCFIYRDCFFLDLLVLFCLCGSYFYVWLVSFCLYGLFWFVPLQWFVFSLTYASLVLFAYIDWYSIIFIDRVYDIFVVLSLFYKLLYWRDGNVMYLIFWNKKITLFLGKVDKWSY